MRHKRIKAFSSMQQIPWDRKRNSRENPLDEGEGLPHPACFYQQICEYFEEPSMPARSSQQNNENGLDP